MANLNAEKMSQDIVAAHGKALSIEGYSSNAQPISDAADPVYTAAFNACVRMSFIDIDADCVAKAWSAMYKRKGVFDASIWPTNPQDFGMDSWPRKNAFPTCPKDLGLYAVLPDAQWVGRMAKAGVPTVQLRFKSSDAKAIKNEVELAVKAVEGTSSLLFVNDHWQAAIDAGAYGVHLGQEDMAATDLDAIRRAGLRLGLSTHGYAEMMRADRASPSYIAMGAVYATTLKKMATPPQGVGRLVKYAALMRDYPLVAIGGIDEQRMPEVMESGVGSIAVVRALVAAADPEQNAKYLAERMAKK